MKPEPTICPACGHEGVTRSCACQLQCSQCGKVGMLYVSMLSAAELQSVRVLVNAGHEARRQQKQEGGLQ